MSASSNVLDLPQATRDESLDKKVSRLMVVGYNNRGETVESFEMGDSSEFKIEPQTVILHPYFVTDKDNMPKFTVYTKTKHDGWGIQTVVCSDRDENLPSGYNPVGINELIPRRVTKEEFDNLEADELMIMRQYFKQKFATALDKMEENYLKNLTDASLNKQKPEKKAGDKKEDLKEDLKKAISYAATYIRAASDMVMFGREQLHNEEYMKIIRDNVTEAYKYGILVRFYGDKLLGKGELKTIRSTIKSNADAVRYMNTYINQMQKL